MLVAGRMLGDGLARPADTIEVGLEAPAFSGTTLDGEMISLADFRGRPVIVNFWGPSCEPCRREFPLLVEKLREHAPEGLAIIGVLMDDPPDPARAFADAHEASWPTVIDPGEAIVQSYKVIARPQSYFIDRDGIVRAVQIGEILEPDFERQYAKIPAP